jgi:hypothetical protein
MSITRKLTMNSKISITKTFKRVDADTGTSVDMALDVTHENSVI